MVMFVFLSACFQHVAYLPYLMLTYYNCVAPYASHFICIEWNSRIVFASNHYFIVQIV